MTNERPQDLPEKVLLEGPGVTMWQTVSEEVLRSRHLGAASARNDELSSAADLVDRPDLASAFRLWRGDNLQFDGQLDAALDAYRPVVERGPDISLFGDSISAAAAVSSAIACEGLGRYEEATHWYQSLPELGDTTHSPAWIRFRVAEATERAGLFKDAAVAYRSSRRAGKERVLGTGSRSTGRSASVQRIP